MSDKLFDPAWIKWSDVPADFIPSGAIIIGGDMATDEDYTLKGFFNPSTGEYHIQQIVHNVKEMP